MKHVRWITGLALAALLLRYPEAAVNGAREALAQWYFAVAPALFPFMALVPLLTCGEALSAYGRVFGGLMRAVFDLPGSAAAPAMVALLAGSPAGSRAIRRSAGSINRGQAARLAMACCGMGPGFLVSGVGTAMLGSASLGLTLLKSQLAAQAAMLFLLQYIVRDDRPVPPLEEEGTARDPLGGAVPAVLSVAGWMALFGALAGAARNLAGERASTGLLCVLEVSSAARTLCGLPIGEARRLALLSAATGFGGLCVALQNLSALGDCGVRPAPFILSRLAVGALAAGFTLTQLALRYPAANLPVSGALGPSCLALCAALVPVLLMFALRKRTEA